MLSQALSETMLPLRLVGQKFEVGRSASVYRAKGCGG
jgi:hypothetical protein